MTATTNVAASARQNLTQEQHYPTGELAVRLDEFGCGFCYYASGRVAACANKINDYQRSFQFYEDNRNKTLLATIDEHAVGSVGRKNGKKMILSKDLGLIIDESDKIVQSWRWDPKAQKAGTPPRQPVVIQLNNSLIFTFKDRSSISVKFMPCPGISVEFGCGECLRRTDTYFDHAHRATDGPQRGKLLINQQVPTLQQRQKRIELESIEKRSKQKPRSQDLSHDTIKSIVADLESKFDEYEGQKVTPAADGNWRENAHLQTLSEIPILPCTGYEVGQEPTLFGSPLRVNDASATLSRLRNQETDKWLGSVEIHERIVQENPVLRRSGPLTNASGRYSQQLAVPGGGGKPSGERLQLLSAQKLDQFLSEQCGKDQLVVVACLRADDRQSRVVEAVLEQVQLHLSELSKNKGDATSVSVIGSKCRLVKCDLAESSALAERYRVHAVPTFLMFYDSQLVHVTSLGGAALRVVPATKNANLSGQMEQLPRVLLVEKDTKKQIATEKMLKKENFQWALAISGEQAVSYFTQLPGSGIGSTHSSSGYTGPGAAGAFDLILLSDTLEDAEIRSVDRFLRPKDKSKPSAVVVCVVVNSPSADIQFASVMCIDCKRAQGRRISQEASKPTTKKSEVVLACPHCGIIPIDHKTQVLSSQILSEVAQVMVYKHSRAATMHRLAELWVTSRIKTDKQQAKRASSAGSYTGLTIESFLQEVEKQLAAAKRGLFFPAHEVPEMALSAKETVLGSSSTLFQTNNNHKTHNGIVVNALRSSSA